MTRAIGGFFPLESGLQRPPEASYLDTWGIPEDHPAFHNLRGAFRFLLETLKPARVWLPGYICSAMRDAVIAAGMKPGWYAVNEQLSPDIETLSGLLAPGDLCLAVDYFGRTPETEFLEYVSEHPEVVWVEDRAQAMLPERSWGDYLLYSPRKLLGVPDGGLVTGGDTDRPVELSAPELTRLDDLAFMDASRHRLEDVAETDNATWYGEYLDAEASMAPGFHKISRLAWETLQKADAAFHARCRHANFRTLYRQLGDQALLRDESPAYVPFGFPLVVEDAGALSRRLAAKRVFAPRYWPDMPGESETGAAKFLYEKVIVLPVDHRYGDEEMEGLAATVKTLL
ncbi:MAG: hypothetical protein O3B72_11110 [Proteobacteria bacterium]|nr:hypothetical protein [Pseudomonadota bacterium]